MPYRSDRPATIRRREQVGDRLRSLRRSKGLSQRALADEVGVDARTIGALESGRSGMTVDALLDIADVLGVPVTRLFVDDRTTSGDGSPGDRAPLV